jgi:Leucine-rich repeat (LRR) protein
LEELYLNDESNLDIESALITISELPNLKYLHLENDNLEKVPNNILRLKQLEMIYLNDNKIKEFPEFMRDMEKLYFIDMQHNLLSPAIENQYKPEGRMKIKF